MFVPVTVLGGTSNSLTQANLEEVIANGNESTVALKVTTMYTLYTTTLNATTLHVMTSNVPCDVTRMFYATVLK